MVQIRKYLLNKTEQIEIAFNYISNKDFVDLLDTIDKNYSKYLITIKNNLEDIKECLEKD